MTSVGVWQRRMVVRAKGPSASLRACKVSVKREAD